MSENNTILIVDDNELNRMQLTDILVDDYSILQTDNGADAIKILKKFKNKICCVMLDLFMPEISGYDVLEQISKSKAYSDIPIIICTDSDNYQNESKALQLGAWDFILKPYNQDIVKFRIKNVIKRSQLTAFEQLKYLSEYDSLTGIYNRAKFFEATKNMLALYTDEDFAFLRFDINRFNLINSFYGIEEGDNLLKYLARQVKRIVKKFDKGTFGRIEADVFVMCIPFESKEQIVDLIKKASKSFRAFNLYFDITTSFGIYIINNHDMPVDAMLDRANLALKKCKGNVVKTYEFYDAKMGISVKKEQEIINVMNDALEKEQFCIYLQPKYSFKENCFVGAEALVRWVHPSKGIIPPNDFIPVFERNGFITKLDYYVWETVCKLLRKWLDDGTNPNPISVNVSRVDLYNPKFVEDICALTKKYNVPNRLLNLELTETAYTDNPQALKQILKRLHENGFVVMMDDFGSGYSSLNVLKDMPVDALKIDMKFLENTETSGRGENIIASVVRMAKWLKIPTIAEGAEKQEQVEFLRGIGCEFVQGYYFSKPMVVDDYEQLKEKQNEEKNNTSADDFDANSLWSSNSHFEKLIGDLSQAVSMYEFDGQHYEIIRVNKAFCDLFGYKNISYEHSNTLEFIDPKYHSIINNALKYAVETKGTAVCEYLRDVADGRKMWIENKIKYVNSVGGRAILIGTLTDISNSKAIDEELQNYRSMSKMNSNETKKILITDDETTRDVLKGILDESYEIYEASNGEEAITILEKHNYKFDLVMIGSDIPVMNGNRFIEYKLQHTELADMPVILITNIDEIRQFEMVDFGVNDFIVKPFVPETVLKKVSNVLVSNKLYKDSLERYYQAIEKNEPDELTGLPCFDSAKRKIQNILVSSNRQNIFAIVDVKGLGKINKSNGHEAGDKVLKELASMLKEKFRNTDIVARGKMDEFILFVCNINNLDYVVDRINDVISKINSLHAENEIKCYYHLVETNNKHLSFSELYKIAHGKIHS